MNDSVLVSQWRYLRGQKIAREARMKPLTMLMAIRLGASKDLKAFRKYYRRWSRQRKGGRIQS